MQWHSDMRPSDSVNEKSEAIGSSKARLLARFPPGFYRDPARTETQ